MEYSMSFFGPSVAQLKAERASSPARRSSTEEGITVDVDSEDNGASGTLANTLHSATVIAIGQDEVSERPHTSGNPKQRWGDVESSLRGNTPLPATADVRLPAPPMKDFRRRTAGHTAEGARGPQEWYACTDDLDTEPGSPEASQNGSPSVRVNDGGPSFEPHRPTAPAQGAPRPSAWCRSPQGIAAVQPRAPTPQAVPFAEPAGSPHENMTQQFFRLAMVRKEERLRQIRIAHGRMHPIKPLHTHRAHRDGINRPRRASLQNGQQQQPQPQPQPQRWRARGHSADALKSAMQVPLYPMAHAVPRAPYLRDGGNAAGAVTGAAAAATKAAPHSELTSGGDNSSPDQCLLHHETPLEPNMVCALSATKQEATSAHNGPVDAGTEPQPRRHSSGREQPSQAQAQERAAGPPQGRSYTYSGLITQMIQDAGTSDSDTESDGGDDDDCDSVEVTVPMSELPPEQREWLGVCPARDFAYVRSPNWLALPVPDDDMDCIEAELSPTNAARDESRGTAARHDGNQPQPHQPQPQPQQHQPHAAEAGGTDRSEEGHGERRRTTQPPLLESTVAYSPLQPHREQSEVAPLDVGGLPGPVSPAHTRTRASSIGGFSLPACASTWGIHSTDGDDDDDTDNSNDSPPQPSRHLHRRAQEKEPGALYASAFASFRRQFDSDSDTSSDSQEMSKSDTDSFRGRAPPSVWQSAALSARNRLTSAFVPPQEEPQSPPSPACAVPVPMQSRHSENPSLPRSAPSRPVSPRPTAVHRFFGRFANMRFMRRKVPVGTPNSTFMKFRTARCTN